MGGENIEEQAPEADVALPDANDVPIPYTLQAERQAGTWDRNLEFKSVKAHLEWRMKRAKNPKTYSCLAALYIQLHNASRVSESVDALNQFIATGGREQTVRVRKKKVKENKPPETRKIIIPELIDRTRCVPRTPLQVAVFAQKRLGINTHSLRYAPITYWSLEKRIPPQILAKITHHSSLDTLVKYIQQKMADRFLETETRPG